MHAISARSEPFVDLVEGGPAVVVVVRHRCRKCAAVHCSDWVCEQLIQVKWWISLRNQSAKGVC